MAWVWPWVVSCPKRPLADLGGPKQWDPKSGHTMSARSALKLASTSDLQKSTLPKGIQEAIYFDKIAKKLPSNQKSVITQQPPGARDCLNSSLETAKTWFSKHGSFSRNVWMDALIRWTWGGHVAGAILNVRGMSGGCAGVKVDRKSVV